MAVWRVEQTPLMSSSKKEDFMLKKGTRAIVKAGNRIISVQSGDDFNKLNYGISALSNDFNDEILFRSALEDARTPEDVLAAAKRYYRYGKIDVSLITDY